MPIWIAKNYMRQLLLLVCILATTVELRSQTVNSTTEVDWFNTAGTLLLDSNGVALSQGTANVNSDGMLLQLGYFTGSTGLGFTGTWVPLTSFGALPHTTIGDASNNPTAGGSGNGRLAFTTVFHFGANVAEVYDAGSGETGAYTTQSQFSIGLTNPPNNQVLGIRFFDTTTGTSGHYNTVESANWQWQTPTDLGAVVLLQFTGSGVSLQWEDALNPFKTSIAIPEPSSLVLAGLGLGLVPLLRRRRKA